MEKSIHLIATDIEEDRPTESIGPVSNSDRRLRAAILLGSAALMISFIVGLIFF